MGRDVMFGRYADALDRDEYIVVSSHPASQNRWQWPEEEVEP